MVGRALVADGPFTHHHVADPDVRLKRTRRADGNEARHPEGD
jgi:hypothetical protein